MITITKTEIEVQDIRELAAAFRDIAEGYASVTRSGDFDAPDFIADGASDLMKFISMHGNELKSFSESVKIPTR